mmetsp:Transcript_37493/g.75977  ORF Transcript_37493/g.75977 Transcript_37493/m.75977 type:complete len:81 (+) Transcript_37493:102-344(+)|eukprot:CAMPEP_0171601794 /NCGR_PEP_ID=MMETSP0990-20121206/5097_1 /TAXON_ID=483369 /ORGANISM="non described non described, Strain CCMP2098" /LENGTH=80 /DNA_ID=CAMNT_0012163943 /DNA_START=26 /DNA_END=268 /DNA_ORIENTATION=+
MELKHKLGMLVVYLAFYLFFKWFNGVPGDYVPRYPGRKDGQGSIDIHSENGNFLGIKRSNAGKKKQKSGGSEWMSDIPPL